MAYRPAVFGARPKAVVQREADRRRGSARERGYTPAWDRAARTFLRANPFCAYCEMGAFGPACTTAAELVDHLYPHKGDQVLFWIAGLWVASCTACHSGPKQVAELKGADVLDRLALLLGRPTLAAALAAEG
jgi:5-methylcytosine-specific restriction endonuclease McrA